MATVFLNMHGYSTIFVEENKGNGEINITGTEIKNMPFALALGHIAKTTCSKLKIGNNRLTDDALAALAFTLNASIYIKEVCIGKNNFTIEGRKHFTKCFYVSLKKITINGEVIMDCT
jgi:hypothetical protein